MSGGYTPVFGQLIFSGSLSGQYPDTAAWLFLLAMADKNGIVDKHPKYISQVTGMPLADLQSCIARFMEPDPASRTTANEGRRLELVDPNRNWGWRILNYGLYREKARKRMQQISATESGRDAERKRAERKRASSGDVRSCPAMSSADRPSDTDTDTDREQTKFDPESIPGLDLDAWGLWVEHRKAIKKPIRPHSMPDAAEALARLGERQLAEVKRARAGGWQGLHPEEPKPRPANGNKPLSDPYAGAI